MARLIFHFVFALIAASYLLSVSDAMVRESQKLCICPSTNPYCNCGNDLQVLTTTVIGSRPDIRQCERCHGNSSCNEICPPTCKYKVCIYNRTCDMHICECYIC
ncbi:PREDICTED: defensin-like protein 268 [Camelina sativa]|uniref:Defensin-like protein 268 n=1 Tax=Camelina sativa TaxID=90675 RepID=A0ABM0VNF1_CAMSA|nr:PREDICTED: defensin-like protein 268 [Camelina sativa]